jgi:hypothetical protein
MWKCFWDWLATLPQGSASFVGTVTGSALGLVALLLGALYNARLNRRRDDRLRKHERQIIAVALHAELSSIENSLVGNAHDLTEKPPDVGGSFLVPDVMHSSHVFQETLPKIGLLDPVTTRKVIDAYILLGQYLQDLTLAGGRMRQDMPSGRRVVELPTALVSFSIEYHRRRAGVVKEALDALSPYLK